MTELVSGERVTQMEVERRFLVLNLDAATLAGILGSNKGPVEEIVQGYLPDYHGINGKVKGQRLRASKIGDEIKFTSTIKTRVANTTSARHETTRVLSPDDFFELWPQTEGARIEKLRYRIPHGKFTMEIDVLKDPYDGVVLVEVEAEDTRSFSPPPWLSKYGREVTDILTNRKLATRPQPIGQLGDLHGRLPYL